MTDYPPVIVGIPEGAPPLPPSYTRFPGIDRRNSVSMLQARLALYQTPNPNGTGTLMDLATAAVNAAADPSYTLWWEYAGSVNIDDPITYAVGTAIGVTQQNAEDLFTLASTL